MRLVPVELRDVKRFIAEHHRHNKPPVGWKFGVGVERCGELVGVAVAGKPIARLLDDGRTLEVTRTCTTGERNANSMLYGAICRAAAALGYERVITYTLASEPGTSLRAAGFIEDAQVAPQTWNRPNRHRYELDLFGNELRPAEAKVRWVRQLKGAA